jgi:DNA-binding beta-propeller fold protein YncE
MSDTNTISDIDAEQHPSAHSEAIDTLIHVPTRLDWLSYKVLASLDWEHLLYIVIIAIAIISRFWDLGARVMSHDESLHTYFSNNLASGKGFAHTPLMHGPFLFHITALSYFLFGASDFTSRIPPALFGVALVALPYLFRRWLGRAGALAAAFGLLISPSILYHARYIRQEEFVLVWTLLTVLCVFRYLVTQKSGWLIGLAVVLALHITDKSTAFLNIAMFMVFLAPLALVQLYNARRKYRDAVNAVLFAGVIGLVLVCASILLEVLTRFLTQQLKLSSVVAQLNPLTLTFDANTLLFAGIIVTLSVLIGVLTWFLLTRLFGNWLKFASAAAPAFTLIVVMVTTTMLLSSSAMLLVLNPLWKLASGSELAATKLLGDMANLAGNPSVIATMFALTMVMFAISVAIGTAWNWRRWLVLVGVFGAITSALFTTIFSNAAGFGTGFVGQLGYWMAQQDVKRGSQPPYYYFLIVPMYEYLLVIGSLCAVVYLAYRLGVLLASRANVPSKNALSDSAMSASSADAESVPPVQIPFHTSLLDQPVGLALTDPNKLFPLFLLWWTVATWVIYTVAGEKMPWLTVHFALPMAMLTGWFLNAVLRSGSTARMVNSLSTGRLLITALLSLLVIVMFVRVLSLIGGLDLQPGDTPSLVRWAGGFLLACAVISVSVYYLMRIAMPIAGRAILMVAFALLSLFTIRTAFMVTFINYDYTREFLFYAHGAPGTKLALSQLEDLSHRLTGDMTIHVGYDADVSWPMTWYMRDYPNARYFSDALPADYEELDAIMIGDINPKRTENEAKLADNYTRYNYMLVWWPMQDYYDLTLERISYSLLNPQARAALWDIIINRDFTRYSQVFNKTSLTPATWSPGHRFALYVRNDVVQKIWSYHAGSASPNTAKPITTTTRLNTPSGIAFAPSGERYVLDRKTNRVVRFDASGAVLSTFGGFGSANGKFNDPWGVAVGADGNIYVADTFNHRIQRFDPNGAFQISWGTPGVSAAPGVGRTTIFFGPRAIAIDSQGRLYVSDTGNKRIQVFDKDGNFIAQFGRSGTGDGEFNEPVGVALDATGNIYVADTWNHRIQVFDPNYKFVRAWSVGAWEKLDVVHLQAIDHKPSLVVYGDLLIMSSPKTHEIIAYSLDGKLVKLPDTTLPTDAVPTGLAVFNKTLYVTNAIGGPVLEFGLPSR